MKERIQELMKQAGTDVSGKWMGVDHATKFAELIVRECISVVDYDDGATHVRELLLEHFGVEERAVPILSDEGEALLSGITSSKLFTIEAAKKAFGVK